MCVCVFYTVLHYVDVLICCIWFVLVQRVCVFVLDFAALSGHLMGCNLIVLVLRVCVFVLYTAALIGRCDLL